MAPKIRGMILVSPESPQTQQGIAVLTPDAKSQTRSESIWTCCDISVPKEAEPTAPSQLLWSDVFMLKYFRRDCFSQS